LNQKSNKTRIIV